MFFKKNAKQFDEGTELQRPACAARSHCTGRWQACMRMRN